MSIKDEQFESVLSALRHYCAYQERCHLEVNTKLSTYNIRYDARAEIIAKLIDEGYLNEERFVLHFAQSKFNQKSWGKVRIKSELVIRKIGNYLIEKALKQIDEDTYRDVFARQLEKALKKYSNFRPMEKHHKARNYLIRQGWEYELISEGFKSLDVFD